MAKIRVNVYKFDHLPHYRAQWVDPITGKKRYRTTGTAIKRDAERFAAKLEAELADAVERPADVAWGVFRQRYEQESLCRKSAKTIGKTKTAFGYVERIVNPATVGVIRTPQIIDLTNALMTQGIEPTTIAGYLRHIRAALNWGKRAGLLAEVPKFVFPENSKRAGGRPITEEELERMRKVSREMRGAVAESWERLLLGLWYSGLRINEAMNLTWNADGLLTMDFTGKRPMFRIKPELSKNRKAERFPMPPEFAEMAEATPESERKGYFFDPLRGRVDRFTGRLPTNRVSEVIADFGRRAHVKVMERNGQPVFASAHDLRRAFGFRWAMRLMPPILQKMMRHAEIQTTLAYYVTQDEDQTAEAVWQALDTKPDTQAKPIAVSR